MKKIASIFLIVMCLTCLTACKSDDYKNAAAEMCSKHYETAFNSFSALGDYEDSAERAEECSRFIIEDLAETAEQNIYRALDEKDTELLIEALLSCQNSPHAQDEVTDHIYSVGADAITAYLKTTEYDNFLWYDSLLNAFHKADSLNMDFVRSLDQLRENTQMDRSAAFLNGNWIRSDTAQSSGLKIGSTYNDRVKIAFVSESMSYNDKEIPRAHFDWLKGMIIMNDINLIEPDSFTLSCLHLYCYYNLDVQHEYYEEGIGRLDLSHNRILTENTNDRAAEWDPCGNPNIYVREEYYIPPEPLTENDFLVNFKEPVKEIFEAGETNLAKWFSYQNKAFYVYELENSTSTSRGISVGSSWDDVVNAYGHGKMNFFQGDADPYFKYLQQSAAKTPDGKNEVSTVFSETAQEYMQYDLDDCTLRFYFADDKVTWIFWSSKEFQG